MAKDRTDGWTCRHFSIANPREDPTKTSLPVLLRRVADEIDKLGIQPMEILDLTVESEMTGEGPWWSVTVYWAPD